MRLEYVLTDVQTLSFEKKVSSEVQLQIQTKTNYNVYYAEDGNSCIGDFYVEILPVDNSEQLKIRYHSKSLFKIHDAVLDDNLKKLIHVEIYDKIFPMCNMMIRNFAASVGLPNISLPMLDTSNMEVIIMSKEQ